MRLVSKSTLELLLIHILTLLLILSRVCQDRFINNCLENWMGEDFFVYTGECVSVEYKEGISFSKLGTRQDSCHLAVKTDEGYQDYYVAGRLCEEIGLTYGSTFENLVSKEVSIIGLPDTKLPACNYLVSLESGGVELLNAEDVYAYLKQKSDNSTGANLLAYFLLSFPFLLCAAVAFWFHADEYSENRKKEQRKRKKMERLREQGMLHPKKQRQKIGKNSNQNAR